MYIQIIDGTVNLIGSQDVGLPLPQRYLDTHPNILCLDAKNYPKLPKLGSIYDADSDTFSEYEDESEPQLTSAPLEAISEQLKALSEKYENDQSYTQEMMLTLASAIAEVYERLDAEALK